MKNEASRISIESMGFERMGLFRDKKAPIFKHVDFDFPMNTMVRLVGQQGSGVSSMLKMLAGIIRPNEGKFLLNGIDRGTLSLQKYKPYQMLIGFGFDQGGLLSNLSLYDNLLLPLLYHKVLSPDEAEKRVCELMDEFDIAGSKSLLPVMASHGIKKTVALARSLIMQPELLILDDPTEGIKREGVKQFVELVKKHQYEKNLKHVIFSSEDEFFLGNFQFETVEIKDQKLVLKDRLEIKHAG